MEESMCSNVNVTLNLTDFEYYRELTLFKKLDVVDVVNIVLYIFVIIGALLGNISVVLSVALNKSMRTTINMYILNLAIADLLICTFCMVAHLISIFTAKLYVLGPFMCRFNSFTRMTCLTSSVLTLSAISCDRFVAVFFPLHARITKQRTSIIICIIWSISMIVSIPFLLVRKHYTLLWKNFLEPKCGEQWPEKWIYDARVKRCIVQYPLQLVYYTFVTVTLFFIPVGIMSTAYLLILWKLWVSKIPGERHASNLNAQQKAKRKVVKMVFLVLVAFIVCWTPFQTIVLYSKYGRSSTGSSEFPVGFSKMDYYSVFIAYSNSLLNPIIYGGCNQKFREGICMALHCVQCRKERITQKSRLTVSTAIGGNFSFTARQEQENEAASL